MINLNNNKFSLLQLKLVSVTFLLICLIENIYLFLKEISNNILKVHTYYLNLWLESLLSFLSTKLLRIVNTKFTLNLLTIFT